MSEIFSRRSFLKGSAALVGATALMSLSGCDGSSKHKVTVQGFSFKDNDPNVDSDDELQLSGNGAPDPNANRYNIGGGITLLGSIGVGRMRHRNLKQDGFYPVLSMFLLSENEASIPINANQFTNVYFNGKAVHVKGLKLVSDGFSKDNTICGKNDSKGQTILKIYLDAPEQDLKFAGQPVSFAFSFNGTKKVRCSGTFSDKPTFTITY